MNILISGACGVTSRAVIRSLKLSPEFRNAVFIGTDICENVYGLHEGLCKRIYRVPHCRDAENYTKIMARICREEKIEAAIVIPELEVMFWAANRMPAPALLPPLEFCRAVISKKVLYERLANTNLVPRFGIFDRRAILDQKLGEFTKYPFWIRDFAEGCTSGKGAFNVHNFEEIKAWITLNPDIGRFMCSEFLPGRNYACILLYHCGKLLKVGIYERLEYFMARTVMSGISGNISRGRLVNEARVRQVSEEAITHITRQTGEVMSGVVTVDLREAADGTPMITEINLRYVAAMSAFAEAGLNMAETQLQVTLGRLDRFGPQEIDFPPRNLILRDIDGMPQWVADFQLPAVGACLSATS